MKGTLSRRILHTWHIIIRGLENLLNDSSQNLILKFRSVEPRLMLEYHEDSISRHDESMRALNNNLGSLLARLCGRAGIRYCRETFLARSGGPHGICDMYFCQTAKVQCLVERETRLGLSSERALGCRDLPSLLQLNPVAIVCSSWLLGMTNLRRSKDPPRKYTNALHPITYVLRRRVVSCQKRRRQFPSGPCRTRVKAAPRHQALYVRSLPAARHASYLIIPTDCLRVILCTPHHFSARH
jgi:hypothetical protein